jgi:hypothetical protein
MLNNNGNKNNCGFADEIVSYIYDEIGASKRAKFEDHLAGCSNCTDEFAAVSEARLSVFEWHREEFAHLPTPEIVIPYKRAHEDHSVGLLTGISRWLHLVKSPVAAAAIFAIVFLGVGFVTLRYLGHPETPIASKSEILADTRATTPVIQKVHEQKTESEQKMPEIVSAAAQRRSNLKDNDIRPAKAALQRQVVNKTRVVARSTVKQVPLQTPSTAPVLSNFEDSSDNSLRLADLFADIDG